MPALLPQRTFVDLPAVDRWFIKARNEDYALLSTDYLAQYSGAQVPLEFSNEDGFERVEQPLSVFLEYVLHHITAVQTGSTELIAISERPHPSIL